DLLQIAHRGDADGDRREDDRRDHHLDQADEDVAERLAGLARVGKEMPDQHADEDGEEDLEIKAIHASRRSATDTSHEGNPTTAPARSTTVSATSSAS